MSFIKEINQFLPIGNPDEETTIYVNKEDSNINYSTLDEIFDNGLDSRTFKRVTTTKRPNLIKFITGGNNDTLTEEEINQIKDFTKIVTLLELSVKELADKTAFDKEKMPLQVSFGRLNKKQNRTPEEETKLKEIDQKLTKLYTKFGKTRHKKEAGEN